MFARLISFFFEIELYVFYFPHYENGIMTENRCALRVVGKLLGVITNPQQFAHLVGKLLGVLINPQLFAHHVNLSGQIVGGFR